MRERGPQRTYGIWGFVAAFAALGAAGLVALLVVGTGAGGTEQLRTPQTIPEDWDLAAEGADADDATASTEPSADETAEADSASPNSGAEGTGSAGADASGSDPSSDSPSPSSSPGSDTQVTLPDGRPAPDGVAEVLVDGEITSYVLTPPPTVTDPGRMEPVVAPMGLAQFDGGSEIRLTIGCARSSQEFLAQIAVTEAADTVTFVAIALAPAGGPPCVPGATPMELFLPLREPVGDRTIVVVPPDSPVPRVGTA